jgi:N-acetylglucosamine malate deacetylase 1
MSEMNVTSDFNSSLPNADRPTVLTIYAHADDEVLPAAGTLLLMSQAGWKVQNLILTDGNLSRSAIKGQRHQEAEAAGKVIGATYELYALQECNFTTQNVVKIAEAAIKSWEPKLIITHAPQPEQYGHRDREVCSIAVSNVSTRKNVSLWFSAPPSFSQGI